MSDLVAFLRARLDEDERALTRIDAASCHGIEASNEGDYFRFIDRAPAEVESKRRLLDDIVSNWERIEPGKIEQHLRERRGPHVLPASETGEEEVLPEWTVTRQLRLLALPYADHPDYREEWRP